MSPSKKKIKQIYIPKVDYVNVNDSAEDVAKLMRKYDLEAIPVINDYRQLLGRITIDDIVDFIKDEAEEIIYWLPEYPTMLKQMIQYSNYQKQDYLG